MPDVLWLHRGLYNAVHLERREMIRLTREVLLKLFTALCDIFALFVGAMYLSGGRDKTGHAILLKYYELGVCIYV